MERTLQRFCRAGYWGRRQFMSWVVS